MRMSKDVKLKLFKVILGIYIIAYGVITFGGFGDQAIIQCNTYGLLDYRTSGYTVEQARAAINDLGTQGMALAQKYYIADYVYLFSGFLVQFMVIRFFQAVMKKRKETKQILPSIFEKILFTASYLVTFVKLVFDLCENTIIEYAMYHSADISDATYRFTSMCTVIKFVSFIAWIPLILLLAYFLLSKKHNPIQG